MTPGRRRIGLVVPGWTAPGRADALPAVADLVRTLAERHALRIVALRYPAQRQAYICDGVAVTPLGAGTRAGVWGRASVIGRAVAALRRLHGAERFDVLHAVWADEAGAAGVLASRLLGIPCVVSVMGGELVGLRDIGYGAGLGTGGRLTTALALRWATLVTVGSSVLEVSVGERTSRPLVRLPLGVDLERFRPAAEGGGERVLWVGSLEPVKDPVTALRAFARASRVRPDARLTMVGEGSLGPDLVRLADRLGITDRVTFAGRVAREELPRRYRAADLLLVTSRHEAQSMVAVEAAASGVPLVGTRVGVLPDLGTAAVAVDGADPVRLGSVLAELLADPARRRAMALAARTVAESDFSLAAQARRLEAAYATASGAPQPDDR